MKALSREERIAYLDKTQKIISKSSESSALIRVVCYSYIMSLVAEGSLEYIRLLKTRNIESSTALFFGLFTSVHDKSDFLHASSCLGRLLLRELSGSQPNADVSYEELPFLLENRNFDYRLRLPNPSFLNVEIYPNLIAPFRLARSQNKKKDVNDKQIHVLRNQMHELRHQLFRVLDITDDIIKPSQGEALSSNKNKYK